jgi:hypothetical protein
MNPWGEFVIADDAVEDNLQRPRSSETHRRLNEHGDKDDDQCSAVGADEANDKSQHELIPGIR